MQVEEQLRTLLAKILDRIERKIGDFDTTNELARKSNIELKDLSKARISLTRSGMKI